MTKIDLITGFLGSGKTTFIRSYVNYLTSKGEKVCILENDYGAINVDTMLLADLKSEYCDIEMVAGGCDYDCHRRRFKTKLITLAMLGFTRVIVEPSGIYDVDEFFDILNESPVDKMYSVSNVITIINPYDHIGNSDIDLSIETTYLLASQAATAGCIVLSHIAETSQNDASISENICHHINQALESIKCNRRFDITNIIAKNWESLSDADFEKITGSGYHAVSFEKTFSMDENGFESLFFMHVHMNQELLFSKITELFYDQSVGNVVRVKGFLMTGETENKWIEINATHHGIHINPIKEGQEVLIVIGENLKKEKLDSYFDSKYSSCRLE